MFRWIPYAFVRIVLFFCIGILLGIHFSLDVSSFLVTVLLLSLGSLYVILACVRPRLSFYTGVTAMAAICCAGFVNVQVSDESLANEHIINQDSKISFYKAVVIQPGQEKEKSWKMEASIQAVKTDHGWVTGRGRVLLYAPKKFFKAPFEYGDVLLVKGAPQTVSGPANPGEFDYQQFLKYRQIYHQHFLREDGLQLLDNNPPDRFLKYAITARQWADNVLTKFIPGEREHSLASALVLGVTDGLDNELMNAYAATGAMHVLSVSGLHVGIVYWLLMLIFKPFQRFRAGKWVMLIVSLTILWAYAFITGISASVLRAVTMFSFAAVAKPWNQQTNIYNILAASAFCLLLYDPFMIMSVGFQLSYLAVIGIVAIQPGLYRLWEPSHWIWDEVWKVAAVSIAAQIATISIGLFYFHQFPNYFLVTNMFVIPGSFIVLILGIAMLCSNFMAPLAELLGWILHWIIKLLNTIVFGIEQMPFSVIDNVHINAMQCWIGIIMVGIVMLWLESKRNVWLAMVTFLCVLFSVNDWLHLGTETRTSKIIVYKTPGSTAIDLVSAGRTHFVGDTSIEADRAYIKFHIQPNRLLSGGARVDGAPVANRSLPGCSLLVWKGKSILRIEKSNFVLPPALAVDVLVLSNNSVKQLAEISQDLIAKQIILDSSNTQKLSTSIVMESKALGLDVFSVLHQGSYELTF